MEEPSGARESRARPRERDPNRHPRPNRDHHPERQRDKSGDRPREKDGDGRRNADRRGDQDRRRDRDPRQERRSVGGHRPDKQRAWEKSLQSQARGGPQGSTWDAGPPPWPAPWETPEPQSKRKEGLGRRGPDRKRKKEPFHLTFQLPALTDEFYFSPKSQKAIDFRSVNSLTEKRACCQMLEILLNLLILACSSVSYNSTGGYTGITSLGGIYYYQFGGAYSGFEGADGEKAQQLDVQFYQLKLPTVTVAMACSGALMAFCCLLIAMGTLRVPWHCPLCLVIEGLLDVLIAVAYIPALYFYFHYLSTAYDSPVCKQREALYQSKGYSGFSCSFHGGDIGAGIFAALGIVAFALGAVVTIRGYQKVRKMKEKPAEMFEL
uniref:MARVEL domain containing 3 n=1 Tax=Loxodonta africana TaxID=9785 RepID=G3U610_LOXAF